MKDYLLDLVQHIYDLGCIQLIKVMGTDTATRVVGTEVEKNLIVDAEFKNPHPDFMGTFGMPNLNKLKILLNLEEYRENATLTLSRDAAGACDGINFSNATGDFCNHYRFMKDHLVNTQVPTPHFKGVPWTVEFAPDAASILKLRMQAQANAEESNLQCRTENGDLQFYFGDRRSTHAGNFVFHSGVSGTLKRAWSYRVDHMMAVLALTGDKRMYVSDEGIIKITVDSGLAVYTYFLPAQSK